MNDRDPVDYVDPRIDSAKPRIRWVFSVGTTRPAGMVRLAANTDPVGTWDAGYRYGSDRIRCFSHLHSWQLSGVPIMPTASRFIGPGFETYESTYHHESEVCEPGYYAVDLETPNIRAELTSTTRVGYHRYEFRGPGVHAVCIDLTAELGPAAMCDSEIDQVGDSVLEGFVENDLTTRRNQPARVYFVAHCNRKLKSFETFPGTERGRGAYLEFEGSTKPLEIKVALSFTGISGARENLAKELPGWNFDQVRDQSRREWNEVLSSIRVEGGSEENKIKFYTDLFRVLSAPQTMSDVNGDYCHSSDGTNRVLSIDRDGEGSPNHPAISLHDGFWNSHWSTNLVLGIVYPSMYRDLCCYLTDFYRDGGLIPRGPTAGSYSYVMIGASSTPFLVGAYTKGIRNFDTDSAFRGMIRNSLPGGLMGKAGYEFESSTGGGIEFYLDRGYIPAGRDGGGMHVDGAAQTLEYAFQDWALSEFAGLIGNERVESDYRSRSKNYRNLFDRESGFMRPKRLDGTFVEPFDPLSLDDFCEANSWQYSFYVPHNPNDLISLMGGQKSFITKLDDAFIRDEKNSFYAPKPALERDRAYINYGNEPGRYVAHLFTHAGAPWLTQKWSRLIKNKTFGSIEPLGFCEDDDIGKAAATSLLLALGLFDIRGGASREPVYEITAPVFDKVQIALEAAYYPGDTFTLEVEGNPTDHHFIQSVELNGRPLSRLWIYHRELAAGGTLKIIVGSDPNRSLGTQTEYFPPSG